MSYFSRFVGSLSRLFQDDTEVDIDIPLVSGSIEGTFEEHSQRAIRAIKRGINNGINSFISEYIEVYVAKETGSLRRGIIAEINNRIVEMLINLDAESKDVTFEFDIPDFPEYAEWHLDGTFGTKYKKPTTPGTKPLTPQMIVQEVKKRISQGILLEFISEGFDIEFFSFGV